MDILQNAPVQYGALGLLIVVQFIAIGALWRRLEQRHKELLKLNERALSSQSELQLLLKGLTNSIENLSDDKIEKLIREYIKKD